MTSGVFCEARGVSRRFGPTVALDGVDLRISQPGLHAIVGPSGSGKTTLLNVLSGLEEPTDGTVHLCGLELTRANATRRARHRAEAVGFVFQRFNLLTTLTARENIELLGETRGRPVDRHWVRTLAGAVGIEGLLDRYPLELSGGQQQRVALVRALAHRPSAVFADEPTGNLDTEASAEIQGLLGHVAHRFELVILMVTHDLAATAVCDSVTSVRNGRVEKNRTPPPRRRAS